MNYKQQKSQQKKIFITNDKSKQMNQEQISDQQNKIQVLYKKFDIFQKNHTATTDLLQEYKIYQPTNNQINLVSLNSSNFTLSCQAVKEQTYLQNKGMKMFEDVNWNKFQPIQENIKSKRFIKNNLLNIASLMQQLKQIKEQIEFEIKQQRIQFFGILQELISFVSQNNIRIDFSSQAYMKQRKESSEQTLIRQQQQQFNWAQFTELKQYCERLQQEKIKSENKFQTVLKMYQTQIVKISNDLQEKFSFSHNCKKCSNYQDQLQKLYLKDQQLIKCEKIIKKLQKNHQNTVKSLQNQLNLFQDQFQLIGRKQNQNKQKQKEKERQIFMKESEIEYRQNNLHQKQKNIDEQKVTLQNQQRAFNLKRQKLLQFEAQLRRQERLRIKQGQQQTQKNIEYFVNIQKKQSLIQNDRQKRSNCSPFNLKTDINQRLKEIKNFKTRVSKNFRSNGSNKLSKESQYYMNCKHSIRLQREYQTASRFISPLKNSSNYSISLNEKLERLSQSLRKDLKQIK